jgi:Fe-S-cluster containining protein
MKCQRCGACCRVFGIVELTENDTQIPKKLRRTSCLGYDMMKIKNFKCIVQDGNDCSIYNDRPEICRKFRPGSYLCIEARKQDERLNG